MYLSAFNLFIGERKRAHPCLLNLLNFFYMYLYNIYVKRKVRIRTILGFCCANLGSELCAIILRIAQANIGSEDLLCKPQICGFCCAGLGFTRNHLGSRNQISAIRGNKPTIDSARKAARPSVAANPRWLTIVACRAGVCACNCTIDCASLPRMGELLCCAIVCGSLPQKVELLCACDRLWLRFCGWLSCFTCAIDRGFVATVGRGLVARS